MTAAKKNNLSGGDFQEVQATPVEKKKKDNNKKNKDKGPGIFSRMWRFLREMVSELKKVTWPKFPKVLKQTGIVLLVVLVFLLVLTGIDSLLAWLLSLLVRI